jgi:hypothetical protein
MTGLLLPPQIKIYVKKHIYKNTPYYIITMKRILRILKVFGNFTLIRDFWWKNYIPPNARIICRNDTEYENRRRLEDPLYLERYGYKIYSQNDEDGIIEEIFNRIGTTDRRFIEFGVQNGLESNCHYLLFKGWTGLWIDGDRKFVQELQKLFDRPIKDKRLRIINAFITTENINRLIGKEIRGELDLLSIDIDGNDYWIWEAVDCINPRVVVIEYNAKFPPPAEWIMPYNLVHIWNGSDLHGASLKSLEKLGSTRGYQLVGTTMNGVNAFFVRKDLTKDLFPKPASAENLYHAWEGVSYRSSGHKTARYIGK